MYVLVGILLSLSTWAHASGIAVEVVPQAPVIILGDVLDPNGVLVKGPWFAAKFAVRNNENGVITIAGMTIKAWSDTKSYGYFSPVTTPTEVQPGQSVVMGPFYIGRLPFGNSTVYTVETSVMGWTGDKANPADRVEQTINFRTK